MVCRPHSSIGGQLLQLWLGTFFFKSPSWIYPTSDHMQWWSYHWGQLFSKQNQPWPSMLDSSIIPGAHQKLAFIKWHYLHERQLPNNLSPTLPFNLQSRARRKKKKEGRERKDMKKQWDFCMGWWSQHPSCCRSSLFPLLQVKPLFFSLSCNILGGFQSDCTWKLVTKQHIHTFHPHEGSFKFWYTRGLMID